MQQEQYFKAVTGLPKEPGWYLLFAPSALPQAAGRSWFNGTQFMHEGTQKNYAKNTDLLFLEPIQLPDAAVLRSALEEVRHHIDTWPDEPERAVRLAAKVIDKALSQTGNEKLHVFTTEELMARDRKMWRQGYAEGEKNK